MNKLLESELDKLNTEELDEMFDTSAGYDDDSGIKFKKGLSEFEHRQATSLYRVFNGLWGLCLVKGDPGTGKDLFGNYITYKIKQFFPNKRIVRDEKPRPLFGKYDALFNEEIIAESIKKMNAIATGKTKDNEEAIEKSIEKVADDWVKGAGTILLKNSVLYCTEFWNYCYNREPHKPINKTMGAIHKVKRHLDCLIIGTVQQIEDLDRKTCLPWVDWLVTCHRSSRNKTYFTYLIQKVKWDRRLNVLLPIGIPFPISFDAGKPRSNMDNGKIVIKKAWYKPETEEEDIVLKVIKSGIDKYEDIVEFIEEYGDMEENEILNTIKNLSFIPRKRVLDFPCYFRLYNSKSSPQIKSSLKIVE